MADGTTYCAFEDSITVVDPELRPICMELRGVISDLHRDRFEVV